MCDEAVLAAIVWGDPCHRGWQSAEPEEVSGHAQPLSLPARGTVRPDWALSGSHTVGATASARGGGQMRCGCFRGWRLLSGWGSELPPQEACVLGYRRRLRGCGAVHRVCFPREETAPAS